MRPLLFLSLCLLGIYGPGCASSRHGLVLDPVGPPPGSVSGGSNPGTLVVFSALDPSPAFNSSPYRYRHTDYQVYSRDGASVVRTVHNDSGRVSDGPARVELPAGQYRVVARANGYGTITVPVEIQASQVTTLHLEGGHWWPKSSSIFQAHPVLLPGGQIVGWPVIASTTDKP